MKRILLTLALLAPTLAQSSWFVTLDKANGYVGKIDLMVGCVYHYPPSTIFAAGTGIHVDPYYVVYGDGSNIPEEASINCNTCKLNQIVMRKDGSVVLECSGNH